MLPFEPDSAHTDVGKSERTPGYYTIWPFLKCSVERLKNEGMKLKINNLEKKYEQTTLSVQELLDIEFPQHQNGMAVAIDNAVIPKSEWLTTPIEDKADVLIITAAQGG